MEAAQYTRLPRESLDQAEEVVGGWIAEVVFLQMTAASWRSAERDEEAAP